MVSEAVCPALRVFLNLDDLALVVHDALRVTFASPCGVCRTIAEGVLVRLHVPGITRFRHRLGRRPLLRVKRAGAER